MNVQVAIISIPAREQSRLFEDKPKRLSLRSLRLHIPVTVGRHPERSDTSSA
jgi:hypothetical protein